MSAPSHKEVDMSQLGQLAQLAQMGAQLGGGGVVAASGVGGVGGIHGMPGLPNVGPAQPTQTHKITIVKGQQDKGQLLPLQLGLMRPAQSNAAGGQQPAVRTLPAAVRLLSPLAIPMQQHTHIARTQNAVGQVNANAKQLTSYHVPRGPATVASLSGPRTTAAPRAPTASPAPGKAIKCWSTTGTQLRPGAVVYTPRPPRPHTLQVTTTAQRPTTLRPMVPQAGTATAVVTRAVRPVNAPSPQRTTPPQQILQTVTPVRTTAPKVVPLVQKNYSSAKVVGVALGVKPNMSPRTVGSTYYYEVSSVVNNTGQPQNATSSSVAAPISLPMSMPVHSLPVNVIPSHTAVASFNTTMNNTLEVTRAPASPLGPQRPSILRKKDNEGSPIKSQWNSPPPSPGGSTTVSAASSPELDDEEPSLPSVPIPAPQPSLPVYNNCSPRKKPRKQLLNSEPRGSRGLECEFLSENSGRTMMISSPPPAAIPPMAPPQPEENKKPPRRAMLGAGWTCDWRGNSLHFIRPSDVKRKEEKRPTVVELAAQKHVLLKANGWKIHHLTAQMDDLIELESGVLQQATEALKVLEGYGHPDLNRVCELLKGNIQRSKIVCEGVAEARTNVLRIFQHKSRVSEILARQADKRCFKKQRNQY